MFWPIFCQEVQHKVTETCVPHSLTFYWWTMILKLRFSCSWIWQLQKKGCWFGCKMETSTKPWFHSRSSLLDMISGMLSLESTWRKEIELTLCPKPWQKSTGMVKDLLLSIYVLHLCLEKCMYEYSIGQNIGHYMSFCMHTVHMSLKNFKCV